MAISPQRGGRALPCVAAIEQQRAGAAGFETFDQGRQVREAPHFAKAACSGFKVEVTHAISLCAAWAHASGLEQMLAHQVRQLALHAAQPNVHAGFTEVNGFELRMAVGHVQKRHLTKLGYVVQTFGRNACISLGVCIHVQASHRASAYDLHEFAFG